MRDKKYYIALDDFERRVVVNYLNEMRNNLIANGKYTDAVDEVLLKIIDAKQKKFKVIYKKARIWKSTFMTKRTVFGTSFKATITFLA